MYGVEPAVNKPHEQVADAEALLGLTSILMDSVRSHTTAGVTPPEFLSCLIREFGQLKRQKKFSDNTYNVSWQTIGSFVSPIFMCGSGLRTMWVMLFYLCKEMKSAFTIWMCMDMKAWVAVSLGLDLWKMCPGNGSELFVQNEQDQ